ncbi:glycosyltransferase family 20-domain-containing protein [Choanephora cucurbitarum]|nr:glycosyltransferase family 20-domain-containing protein [Choanephora cucurbitarum]
MIDHSHLKHMLPVEKKLEGKVINVVNQIPYNCAMNQISNNKDILKKVSMNNNNNVNSDHNDTPISLIERRRRSTVIALGHTNIWQLSTRRGHSAMYAALDSLKKDYRTLYIGSTGPIFTHPDKFHVNASAVTEEQKESLKELLGSKHDTLPLFINEKLSYGHYEGYSKQVLWPLMHYLMWPEKVDEKTYWEDYVKVNEIFADSVIQNYEDGDQIWIHDYHLMLVPQMIRNALPNAPVGLFLHTPFPSSELFRCLPHRKEVLKGMLGANIIAFQTYNYARHFASNCTRIMGCEYTPSGIIRNGILTQIEVYPIGIDVERTRHHCQSPGVEPKAKAIRKRYATKKIIVGRDKLDPVKGVLQKLEAFESFLVDFPAFRDKVVLIQVTSPGVLHSPELENKASEIVGRINSRFGSLEFSPAHLFNQHIDRDEYYALLKVADIGLITPVMDGMNTLSCEFVVAQEEHHSPLILSEFTGTASSMGAAVIVNPWNRKEIARAIAECLSMNEEEKSLKYKQLHAFVTSHTASYWARSLVNGLLKFAHLDTSGIALLDALRLRLEYQDKHKRAFFLNYDGTLAPTHIECKETDPHEQIIDVLTKLTADPTNIVWVISGKSQHELERCLSRVPRLGLASEHGCIVKDPEQAEWTQVISDIDVSWKESIIRIFEYYTERTPGSSIEERKCTIAWHYEKADSKFGAFQARELQNHIEQNMVGKLPVECIVGRKMVEIRPIVVNRGSVIKRAAIQYPDIDYVVCVDDSRTTEDMFRMLQKVSMGQLEVIQFKIIVGSVDRNTLANWKLNSSQELISALQTIVE